MDRTRWASISDDRLRNYIAVELNFLYDSDIISVDDDERKPMLIYRPPGTRGTTYGWCVPMQSRPVLSDCVYRQLENGEIDALRTKIASAGRRGVEPRADRELLAWLRWYYSRNSHIAGINDRIWFFHAFRRMEPLLEIAARRHAPTMIADRSRCD
ncbi:hypothetical protein CYMTET_37398 [Cymbomonas tetramitiformis]|uniref:Uncharacterized protein n=1 Tax=Cymbomonas tetramitiformis TaxID=36881 RepID=A0AAE0CFL1_9CHLO|nr:hypothetical protein CYMTET_37398 [Cymbomonas tetramitiformis]